jgi:hypothetical protein
VCQYDLKDKIAFELTSQVQQGFIKSLMFNGSDKVVTYRKVSLKALKGFCNLNFHVLIFNGSIRDDGW